jgi:hypothetical protein
MTGQCLVCGLGLVKIYSEENRVTSQQSARLAARRSTVNARAVLRKQRSDRERRLEALAVEVFIVLGERDGAVRDAELRAGGVLLAMTEHEGVSMREAVWCGGGLTLREVTRLRRLADQHSGGGAS